MTRPIAGERSQLVRQVVGPAPERREMSVRELRDPRGATQSGVHTTGPGTRQLPKWDAERGFAQGFDLNWLINRSVNIIADKISALPFRAGPDPDQPGEYEVGSRLARLLGPAPGHPSSQMSSRTIWKSAIVNWLVGGRFAWEIEYAGDQPFALWPLIAPRFNPLISNGGKAYFDGFEYALPGVDKITYAPREVVYGYNHSSLDPREAVSPLQAVALNGSLLIELDLYQFSFIKNDAKPAVMIVHGPFADVAAKRAFQRQWNAEHRGARNAGKSAFVEVEPTEDGNVGGVVDVKPIGATAKDSQLTEIYQQQLQAVSGGLGVPMSLLDASGRTFDNAEQEWANFEQLTIIPLVQELQDVINLQLAPFCDDGRNVGWFDLSSLVSYKKRLPTGVTLSDVHDDLLRSERRALIGFGSLDDAQELELQAEIDLAKPAAVSVSEMDVQPKSADPEPVVEPDPQAEQEEAARAAAEAERVQQAEQEQRWRHQLEEQARQQQAELLRRAALDSARTTSVARLQSMAERLMGGLNTRQSESVMSRAIGKRGRQMLDAMARGQEPELRELYDASFWPEQVRAVAETFYEAVAATAAGAMAGAGYPVLDEVHAQRWADARAQALTDRWVAAQEGAVRTQLAEGLSAKDAREDLVARVRGCLASPPVDAGELVRAAYAGACSALAGVSADSVLELLARMTSGQIDLDEAMKEMVGQ